jgi:hypothetical protein
MDNADV